MTQVLILTVKPIFVSKLNAPLWTPRMPFKHLSIMSLSLYPLHPWTLIGCSRAVPLSPSPSPSAVFLAEQSLSSWWKTPTALCVCVCVFVCVCELLCVCVWFLIVSYYRASSTRLLRFAARLLWMVRVQNIWRDTRAPRSSLAMTDLWGARWTRRGGIRAEKRRGGPKDCGAAKK